METARLSSKGQLVIPKSMRDAHGWESGTDLQIIDTGEGVLLRSAPAFAPSTLAEVAGVFRDQVAARSDAEIAAALQEATRKAWRGRD